MPRLEDLITKDSVRTLHEAYKAGLLIVEERNTAEQPHLHHDEMDVNEAVVRYVYTRLMETAKKWDNPPNPQFPYRSTRHITTILRGDMEKEPRGISQGVFRLLIGNKIAWKQTRGRAPLWLRAWPEGEPLRWMGHHTHTTEDWKTEQSIKREAANPKVVVVTHDLSIMPVPAMNPTAIKEWVSRFVPAALDVQRERDALAQRVAELEKVLADIEDEGWHEVNVAIADAMGRASHQGVDVAVDKNGVVLTKDEVEEVNGK